MKLKIYSSDLVKSASKNQLWIPVFIALGCLLAFPVCELIMFGNWTEAKYGAQRISILHSGLWYSSMVWMGFFIALAAGVVNGINGFWYLYSSRKVDFHHSLPVKRNWLFFHRAYTGLLYYLIPYVVMEFLAVCISAAKGYFSLELMQLALGMLVFHLTVYLMFYFSSVLVISMTGTLLMGGLSILGIFLYGPVLEVLVTIYQSIFFSASYVNLISLFFVDGFGKYFSPLELGVYAVCRYEEKEMLQAYLPILGAVLLLAVCAYFAYVKRPSESTGKSMVYGFSEPVLRLVMTVPAGLAFGMIFYLTQNGGKSGDIWWVFGLILGTVLAYGMMGVIYRLDFHGFLSGKPQFLISAAAVALCAVIFRFDLLGYDTYMPPYEKLKTINLDFNMGISRENTEYIFRNEKGYYEKKEIDQEFGYSRINSIGISPDIYESLKNMIDTQMTEAGSDIYFVPVQYVLNSGKSVLRQYMASTKQIENLMKASYEEGTYKEEKYAFLDIEDKYLEEISGEFQDGERYVLFQDEKEKLPEITAALKKDIEEASADVFLGIPAVFLSITYRNLPMERTEKELALGYSHSENYYADIMVYPEFKRTLAILKETGYPVTMEEVPVDSVTIKYYKNDYVSAEPEEAAYADEESEEITYEEPQMVEILKQCMAAANMIPLWSETAEGIDVQMEVKDNKKYAVIPENKLPDFVREEIEAIRE